MVVMLPLHGLGVHRPRRQIVRQRSLTSGVAWRHRVDAPIRCRGLGCLMRVTIVYSIRVR